MGRLAATPPLGRFRVGFAAPDRETLVTSLSEGRRFWTASSSFTYGTMVPRGCSAPKATSMGARTWWTAGCTSVFPWTGRRASPTSTSTDAAWRVSTSSPMLSTRNSYICSTLTRAPYGGMNSMYDYGRPLLRSGRREGPSEYRSSIRVVSVDAWRGHSLLYVFS